MSEPSAGERSPAWPLLGAIAVVLLGSRALWILWAQTVPVSDFAVHHELAVRIAAGAPLDLPLTSRLGGWGYPVALGLVYRLLGAGPFAAGLFDLLLAGLSLVLVAVLAARVGGRRAGTFAAVLFLAWPEQLVFSSVLATEHLAVALTLLALILLVPGPQVGSLARSAAAGAATGLAVAVRPALVSLAAAGTASLLLDARSRGTRAASAAVFAVAALATVLLWNGSVHRALGTGPIGSGWYSLMVGANAATGGKWSEEDLAAFVSRSGEAPAHDFARREALRRIESQGARYAALVLRKMGTLWRDDRFAWRWSTAEDGGRVATPARTAAYRTASDVFHALVWILAVLGAASAAIAPRGRPAANAQGARLLLLFLASGTLVHGVLETQSRYHYALEPAALVLAAVALDRISSSDGWVRSRRAAARAG